jgi:hypothetical protein
MVGITDLMMLTSAILKRTTLFACLFAGCVAGAEEFPAGAAFFEKKIRPILVKHCYECHSAKSKPEDLGSKLYLDTREGTQIGGQSGKIIDFRNADKSLLIQALRYQDTEMPPDEPLAPQIVADFVKWIEMGAPDPREDRPKVATKSDATFWSFQKVSAPAPPKSLPGWAYDPIDQFVLAQLRTKQLTPTRDASSKSLVRRLYFDLTGLPPSMGQVATFTKAYAQFGQAAVENLVNELLASPRFGERWGRHWLDVARYGESNGNDGLSRNPTFPHAWRYRDYVIAALNEDLPYDRFLTEQIAGDLLPAESDAQRDRHLIATGFLAMGSKPAKAMNTNFEMDVVADQIDVISTGVMALSVACARCHDHKFDPIPTSDYYAMAGIFKSTEPLWGVSAHEGLSAPGTKLHELRAASKVLPNADDKKLNEFSIAAINGGKKPNAKLLYKPGVPVAMGVRDRSKPADCKININGDAKKLGKAVGRGVLTGWKSSGANISTNRSGRLELAEWLTDPQHPLTARVRVNRIWQHLFGRGIVETVDEFGLYGQRPTHPELLDHLAARFVDGGWSVKKLIRSVVLSRTYQLSSWCDPRITKIDPTNKWLARHKRRRLDAESLRDSILLASGELDLRAGAASRIRHLDVQVNKLGNLHLPSSRRSVYLCMLRSSPPPELAAFDLPDAIRPQGKRHITTLPTHALYLYNSPLVVKQSTGFAERLLRDQDMENEFRVRAAYENALHRLPSSAETARAIALVESVEADLSSNMPETKQRRLKAWSGLCQALLASNEFRYID